MRALVELLAVVVPMVAGGGIVWLWYEDRPAFPWPTPQPRHDIEYRNVRLINIQPVPALFDWADEEHT